MFIDDAVNGPKFKPFILSIRSTRVFQTKTNQWNYYGLIKLTNNGHDALMQAASVAL
jgi:hypothetical protein